MANKSRAKKIKNELKNKVGKRGPSVDPDAIFIKRKMLVPILDIKGAYEFVKERDRSKGIKWTWALLAKKAGLKNKNNVGKWMNPKTNSNLSFRTIKLVSAVLEWPIGDLIVETARRDRVRSAENKHIRKYQNMKNDADKD